MIISKKIEIDAPAAEVWKVLATDFHRADVWMSAVPRSHALHEGTPLNDAEVSGRLCELSLRPDGMTAHEAITAYDSANKEFTIEVIPQNAPSALPITKNLATFKVNALGPNRTEVEWRAVPQLKPMAYLMYPLVKAGLGKSFLDILDELKYFVETGQPHPRKVKALEKAAERGVVAPVSA